MDEQSQLYYKLRISQILDAHVDALGGHAASPTPGASVFDDSQESSALFRFQSIRFRRVWIQGSVQLFDDDDDNNGDGGNTSDLMKSTSSSATNSDLARFMLTDDDHSFIMVVKPSSILSIDIAANQYILVAGTLVHDEGEDIRFVLIEKMADLSHNAQAQKELWEMELKHIQSKIYNITAAQPKGRATTQPDSESDASRSNITPDSSDLSIKLEDGDGDGDGDGKEDEVEFHFADDDEDISIVDKEVSRIDQDESRYSFHDEYEDFSELLDEQVNENGKDKRHQNESYITVNDDTNTSKNISIGNTTNDTEMSDLFTDPDQDESKNKKEKTSTQDDFNGVFFDDVEEEEEQQQGYKEDNDNDNDNDDDGWS